MYRKGNVKTDIVSLNIKSLLNKNLEPTSNYMIIFTWDYYLFNIGYN